MSNTNGHLDRAAILACTDLPRQEVDIPEWSGKVWIRCMTAGDRDSWEQHIQTVGFQNIRAKTAVACVCDEHGNLIFTDKDLPAISALHGKALDRIFEAAVLLSKVGKADLEDLKKNSGETPQGDSSSSSQGTWAVPFENSSKV